MAKKDAATSAKKLMQEAIDELQTVYEDEMLISATPMEVSKAMYLAIEKLESALKLIDSVPEKSVEPLSVAVTNVRGPTRVQGQYLAYINEFIMRNRDGIAPSHAELQWFFQTTPPSVNSMLKKLDELGYIEREPGVARSIKITIDPALIPPLDQPFRHG